MSAPSCPTLPSCVQLAPSVALDCVEVFCRLRPWDADETSLCVERCDGCTLKITSPSDSVGLLRTAGTKQQIYRFAGVFDTNVDQKEVFDGVARSLVRDCLQGKRALLFAYGVTGSGKTHTMIGPHTDPGIIPRVLNTVFVNIRDYQAHRRVFKPDGYNGFLVQSEADAMLERQRDLMAMTQRTPAKRMGTPLIMSCCKRTAVCPPAAPGVLGSETDSETASVTPAGSLQSSVVVQMDSDCACAVFVTYVEIYNNYVYDLLEETSPDNMKRNLQSRTVREDAHGIVYVHEANEIEVSSLQEAMEALRRGQKRRKVASTALNTDSSRSHSIFTVRVVMAPLDTRGEQVMADRSLITVGQISLVDLAGSERAVRTRNQGDTIREGGNINNSLMALRKFFDALRNRQRKSERTFVKYRDYRLTHLFKNFLDGQGRVRMIVCVNPRSEEYDETINVLKFAELTKEILIPRVTPKQQAHLQRREDILREMATAAQSAESNAVNLLEFSDTSCPEASPVYCFGASWPPLLMASEEEQRRTLSEVIATCERRIKRRRVLWQDLSNKENAFRENLVRYEMQTASLRQENSTLKSECSLKSRHIEDLELRIGRIESKNQEMMQQLQSVTTHKRQLEEQLEKKCEELQTVHEQNDKAKVCLRQRYEQQHTALSETVQRERNRCKRACIQSQSKQQKLDAIKQMLLSRRVGAGEGETDSVVSSGSTASLGSETAPSRAPVAKSRHREQAHRETAERSRDMQPSCGTTSARKTRISITPQPNRKSNNIPITAHRRRSNSVDSKKWLDHKPGYVLELATIFQPKMHKRKSVSTIDSKDVLDEKTSKYALTHQHLDASGHVETHLIKGDILPTVSGGKAVVFNDVESLTQSDPIESLPVNDTVASSPFIARDRLRRRCATSIEGHPSVTAGKSANS